MLVRPGPIWVDDPTQPDVRDLIARHLAFAGSLSPPQNVFALDALGLLDPDVTRFSYRRDGELLAIGALRQLDLYRSAGFIECGPFGDYQPSPYSTFLSLAL